MGFGVFVWLSFCLCVLPWGKWQNKPSHACHYTRQRGEKWGVICWTSADYYNNLSGPAKDIWPGSLSSNLQNAITTTHNHTQLYHTSQYSVLLSSCCVTSVCSFPNICSLYCVYAWIYARIWIYKQTWLPCSCTESLASIRMEFKIEFDLKIAFIVTWAWKSMVIFIHQVP